MPEDKSVAAHSALPAELRPLCGGDRTRTCDHSIDIRSIRGLRTGHPYQLLCSLRTKLAGVRGFSRPRLPHGVWGEVTPAVAPGRCYRMVIFSSSSVLSEDKGANAVEFQSE